MAPKAAKKGKYKRSDFPSREEWQKAARAEWKAAIAQGKKKVKKDVKPKGKA